MCVSAVAPTYQKPTFLGSSDEVNIVTLWSYVTYRTVDMFPQFRLQNSCKGMDVSIYTCVDHRRDVKDGETTAEFEGPKAHEEEG